MGVRIASSISAWVTLFGGSTVCRPQAASASGPAKAAARPVLRLKRGFIRVGPFLLRASAIQERPLALLM
ncbi:hypothetical protein GCM10010403_05490 [Glycomyces rutgersensis]|uniref:Secreted protein n=1 Tax=Glycomyces rutgersensis TaxID=58115 RepID=A0ABN3F6U6_9ACTN